jgi:hypothetical protein
MPDINCSKQNLLLNISIWFINFFNIWTSVFKLASLIKIIHFWEIVQNETNEIGGCFLIRKIHFTFCFLILCNFERFNRIEKGS